MRKGKTFKSLTLLLALCMIVASFVGCSPKKSNTPLTIWVGVESVDFYTEKMAEYVEKYKEKTGEDFPFSVSVQGVDTASAAAKVLDDLDAGADIFTVAHDNLGKLTAGASAIAPVRSEALLAQINADNPETFLNVIDMTVQGTKYTFGIPYIAQSLVLMYNTKYLSENDVLFIEPENQRHLSFVDPDKCLSVKDYSQKNVEPLPEEYPDLNASPQQLPIRSSSFHSVISNFVFEHITHPRLHLQEIARILKPGGYAIITGPGDVYPSHKVPYNYFNIIRYGYHEMFRENDLELVMEHFPARSWMSILYLVYITTVRNSWFNTNQFTKLLHMVVFGLSTVVFPPLNLLAVLLDLMTPFDKRVYGIYMAVIKKPIGGG